MLKLLYGTSNVAKINYMKDALKKLDIQIIGLNDVGLKVCSIEESGNNPLENARIKAQAYYKFYKNPIFSCDSGLYIDGIEKQKQPGVYVRRVNGKELSDEEMINYYSSLAEKMGGQVKAKYKNSICLILDSENVFEYDGDNISSEEFIITSKPHKKRNKGFPLDSISIDIKTGKYYMDLPPYDNNKGHESNRKNEYNKNDVSNENNEEKIKKGYVKFFKDVLSHIYHR